MRFQEREWALQTVRLLRAAVYVMAAMFTAPAIADDAAPAAAGDRFVRPSVEELAIPHAEAGEAAEADTREAMCLMIESAARANDLPLEFFARVIWQESRFQSDAVGPVTRSGQRAQGIAQFMPGTASERRLLDPFDPVQALPKSAEFLERVAQPVRQSRAGGGGLQCRTAPGAGMARRHRSDAAGDPQLRLRDHRHTVDDWAAAGQQRQDAGPRAATSSCRELMALLRARAQSVRHPARAARHARPPPNCGACSSPPASTATRRWRCMRARSSGSAA